MKHVEIRISCKGTYDAGFVVSISNDAFILAWATPDSHYSGVHYIYIPHGLSPQALSSYQFIILVASTQSPRLIRSIYDD